MVLTLLIDPFVLARQIDVDVGLDVGNLLGGLTDAV